MGIIRKQQVNMIGSYHKRILKEDGSNKRLLRTCLLVFAVLALFCLTSPASSLPLEGAFGNDDNRFRFRINPSSSDINTPSFLRKRRRTLPFQLMSQPEPPIYVNANRFREGTDAEIQPKISASELLSLLGNLANEYPGGQKRQMRFGLF